ncbi:MAG: SurA N-terminal domain-containing protein [Gammaproteobacteria bacterium]|nr:SurA N-terminal domain-containing protein [Gammaproteobacteria bacterium]
MLQDIRDNSQGVVAKVIIGLIVAVFALWGVDSIIGGFVSSPSVAEIDGEEISEQQLAISTQNLIASLGGNVDNFDQGLIEQVSLSRLIEEVLLRQTAQDASMRISEDRIDRAILETPQFQLNGVFDSDLAVRTMAAQQLNVPAYRDQLRRSMLLSQIANAYSASGFVTLSELERVAALRLQSRDFRFVALTLGTRTLGEAIPDADITRYYEENQAQFTIEEMVSVQYVDLNKAAIMDEINIEESLVQEQYERERETFEGSAERRASHILFEVGAGISEGEAMEQANSARQRLNAGEDFAMLALEFSSDTVSAEDGGIGYSDGSAFPQAIEDALLELAEGEISDPVVTEFGVHLVMLTEDAAVAFGSFDEVSERIIRDLKSEEAELLFARRLEDMSNMAFESPDLQALATQLNLEVQESELFPRSGGRGIFFNPSVVSEAFSQDVLKGEFNSNVVEINDSQALVLRSLARQEAQVRPREEVEGEIAVVLRTELEKERALELGERLFAELQASGDIDALLIENELEWVELNDTVRDSRAVNQEITRLVFSLPKPVTGSPVYEGVTLSNGTYVVIELNSVSVGDLSAMADMEKADVKNSLLTQKGQAEFGAFLGNLREEADITSRLADNNF